MVPACWMLIWKTENFDRKRSSTMDDSRPSTTSSTSPSTKTAAASAPATAGEHDPAAPLRHRPHQEPRTGRRRDHAPTGQKPQARARLAQDDREHRTARRTRLNTPLRLRASSASPPSTHEGRPVTPRCRRRHLAPVHRPPHRTTMTAQSSTQPLQRRQRKPVTRGGIPRIGDEKSE